LSKTIKGLLNACILTTVLAVYMTSGSKNCNSFYVSLDLLMLWRRLVVPDGYYKGSLFYSSDYVTNL